MASLSVCFDASRDRWQRPLAVNLNAFILLHCRSLHRRRRRHHSHSALCCSRWMLLSFCFVVALRWWQRAFCWAEHYRSLWMGTFAAVQFHNDCRDSPMDIRIWTNHHLCWSTYICRHSHKYLHSAHNSSVPHRKAFHRIRVCGK